MARRPGKSHRESLYRRLQDPTYAAGYLNAAYEEDGMQGLVGALGDVVKAHGAQAVSASSEISRSGLHQITSQSGNPTVAKLESILSSLDLKIEVKPVRKMHAAVGAEKARPAVSHLYALLSSGVAVADYHPVSVGADDDSSSTIWQNAILAEAHA